MYGFRMMNQVIYNLKNLFGKSITVITKQAKTTDLTTGEVTQPTQVYTIGKAVVAPPSMLRGRLSSIASGTIDLQVDLLVLLDYVDVPTVTQSATDWFFEIDGLMYSVHKCSKMANSAPILFQLIHVGEQE